MNNNVHIIRNKKTLLRERLIKKRNIITLNVSFRLYLNVSFRLYLNVSFRLYLNVSFRLYLNVSFRLYLNVSFRLYLNVSFRLYLNVSLTFTDFILASRAFQMTQPALCKVVVFVEGWT